jgi:hypothetical protein
VKVCSQLNFKEISGNAQKSEVTCSVYKNYTGYVVFIFLRKECNMELKNFKEQKDLDKFYSDEKIYNDREKIDKLKELIGIVATRGAGKVPEKEMRIGLEKIVLNGQWKALA